MERKWKRWADKERSAWECVNGSMGENKNILMLTQHQRTKTFHDVSTSQGPAPTTRPATGCGSLGEKLGATQCIKLNVTSTTFNYSPTS